MISRITLVLSSSSRPSLPSPIFSLFSSSLFEILADKVPVMLRRWATKLPNLNVVTLGLGSPIYFFKPPHNLQMSPFSPKMHKKPSIKYKVINTLIMYEMTRKHDKPQVYDECFSTHYISHLSRRALGIF